MFLKPAVYFAIFTTVWSSVSLLTLVESKSRVLAIRSRRQMIGRTASEEVFLHLVFSKCVPILIYGLECFNLTKSDEKAIDFPLIRLLMKFFKTTDITVINECRLYFGIDLPNELIKKRSVKLAKKNACNTNNFYRYLHCAH